MRLAPESLSLSTEVVSASMSYLAVSKCGVAGFFKRGHCKFAGAKWC